MLFRGTTYHSSDFAVVSLGDFSNLIIMYPKYCTILIIVPTLPKIPLRSPVQSVNVRVQQPSYHGPVSEQG